MTTTIPAPLAAEEEPFPYGWRYVKRVAPNGFETIEQVPLTLEDVLHPREGDQVPEGMAHERRRRHLTNVLAARLADDASAVVLSDILIAWDTPGVRPMGPDVAVILGVRERKPWGTFDVAEEGARPVLVIELTSPRTAVLDRSDKLDLYEQAGVAEYVIIDAVRGGQWGIPRLVGFHLGPDGYQSLSLDARGRLWLEAVRLWLGVTDGEIVLYDEQDRPQGDYTAVRQALATTERRADQEQQRADQAEQRADQAEQRADQAERRLAEEAAARADLEARLAALEAEVRRLRRDDPAG